MLSVESIEYGKKKPEIGLSGRLILLQVFNASAYRSRPRKASVFPYESNRRHFEGTPRTNSQGTPVQIGTGIQVPVPRVNIAAAADDQFDTLAGRGFFGENCHLNVSAFQYTGCQPVASFRRIGRSDGPPASAPIAAEPT